MLLHITLFQQRRHQRVLLVRHAQLPQARQQLQLLRLPDRHQLAIELADADEQLVFTDEGARSRQPVVAVTLHLEVARQPAVQLVRGRPHLVEDVAAPLLRRKRDLGEVETVTTKAPVAGAHEAEDRRHHRVVVDSGVELEDVVELEGVAPVDLRRRRLDFNQRLVVEVLGDEDHNPEAVAELAVARLDDLVAAQLGASITPVLVELRIGGTGR